MIIYAVSILVAGVLYVCGELLRRRIGWSNEASRKLVHFLHGALLAIWPFTVGYSYVIFTQIALVVASIGARKLGLFPWMWKVGRKSWGEFAYPVGIICAALLAESKWIFLIAVLVLAFADSIAALVGKAYGKMHQYKILGQNKSTPGSLAFFVSSWLIISVILLVSPLEFGWVAVLSGFGLAMLLTVVENTGVYGADNALLPIVSVVVLNVLS